MRPSTDRLAVGVVLALSLATLGLQAGILRPHLWPAGAGLTVSGDTVFGSLAEPRPLAVIRPPNIAGLSRTPVTITRVWPGSAAEAAGLREGLTVVSILDASGNPIRLDAGLPDDPRATLRLWREWQRARPGAPITFGVTDAGAAARSVVVDRPPVWTMDGQSEAHWLRQHLGPIAQSTAFLAGAAVLLFLGARGSTATLMMLALIATAVANAGPLLGAETAIPLLGPLLLIFNWLVTPLSFPVIGLAVLYFPQRAKILDRHRWIPAALALAALPMLFISATTAGFLLGVDAALPWVAWFAERAWTFDVSFALLLLANVLIVVEGIRRYRVSLDINERRRVQIVVFTGVPAVFAYALKAGVPLVGGLLTGRTVSLSWWVEAFLQAVILLPAVGLPYAVAVRHIFSPRTVLRVSLQYALARRTIAALVVLPIVLLGLSLVQQRDQSLAAIVGGRPLFYLLCLAMLGLGLRYRDRAQRWLDQRFFRDEYDAREILVSLANRVPYEADPRELVGLVVAQIDSALHPQCVAVFAENAGAFEPVAAVRIDAATLAGDSALVTLLRWSDKPLEVFLDDDQSPVARIPPADRAWLGKIRAALLVPIFAGGSDPRPFVGLIALGHKRSEEPFTPEDRELLRGIAVQMGVALDLSRLRRKASESAGAGGTQRFTPTVVAPGALMPASMSTGAVVDGKYRVETMIGQGGMGAVYRAWDLRLERAVAIKVVRADMMSSPDARARFQKESQIVARLQHPSIVTVFDYGTLADGAAFLVMEFVPGEDLRQLLKRERTLAPERMLGLLEAVASGVDSAHKSGVFHRDLKPENILLPASGTGPKVVDFGVAKISTPNVDGASTTVGTASGTIVGTPAYMAPEQLRGTSVDGRADVFSLGAMAYEMLVGKLPYGGGSFIDIGMKQAAGEQVVDTAGLSDALAAAIRRSIAYDRDVRPGSPLEFVRELRRAATS